MRTPIQEVLFAAASGMDDAEERQTLLDHACRDDPEMRELIEGMLAVRADAEDFFEMPPEPADVAGSGETGDGNEEEPNIRIGPYRLAERIGAGGCGVVYLAEQREPVRRQVALKIIRMGMDTESVIARFEMERQALALMDHPNIARVLDAGATGTGRPYFVMELADGERITGFCDCNRLGLRERLDLFVVVCEAIQHAHQKGVIHRDIKPSNVLVREEEGRIAPKVIDFGIAKVTAGELDPDRTATRPGQSIGTPAYMSPEQAEGTADVDTRSDIYSLGALLCELLTGAPPRKPETSAESGDGETRGLLREDGTELPSRRLRNLPKEELAEIALRRAVDPQRLPAMLAEDLDGIILKATDHERPRRYETANGLAMDVRRYLRGEPVLARPPSRWYLLSKLVRRNRGTFAAVGIALFGLLVGLGVSTWLFLREREARHEQARLRMVAEQATANEIRLRRDATAADLVRQAAVLVKYGDIEPADSLLAELTAERAPRSLEAAATFMTVANWNLEQGRRETAADRFHTLGHVLTSVDKTDSEGISFDFLSVATAVSMWGGPDEYDELRTLAIGRFADSANPIVAEHVIKATLLEPADPPTLERLKPLVAVLEDSLERMEESAHLMAWQQFSLALMAYRQGDLPAAAEWARGSLDMATNSAPRTVSNRLLLAMIGLQRERSAAARSALDELREEVDGWMARPFRVINPDGTLWYNQFVTLVLLREAERMAYGGE